MEESIVSALEEIEHAKYAFAFASVSGGSQVGPNGYPAHTLEISTDLTRLLQGVATEGGVSETIGTAGRRAGD